MRQTTKYVPEGFIEYQSLDLSSEPRLLISLNLAGLVLFIVFGVIFLRFSQITRPELQVDIFSISLLEFGLIIVIYFVTLLLHEMVHGLFFLLITHSSPKFGFKGFYAYAASPNHFIPRLPYAVVGLSPFFIITLIGLATILYVPKSLVYPIIFALTVNASGAVGDLYIIGWLLTIPGKLLINDQGDIFTIYQQQKPTALD